MHSLHYSTLQCTVSRIFLVLPQSLSRGKGKATRSLVRRQWVAWVSNPCLVSWVVKRGSQPFLVHVKSTTLTRLLVLDQALVNHPVILKEVWFNTNIILELKFLTQNVRQIWPNTLTSWQKRNNYNTQVLNEWKSELKEYNCLRFKKIT